MADLGSLAPSAIRLHLALPDDADRKPFLVPVDEVSSYDALLSTLNTLYGLKSPPKSILLNGHSEIHPAFWGPSVITPGATYIIIAADETDDLGRLPHSQRVASGPPPDMPVPATVDTKVYEFEESNGKKRNVKKKQVEGVSSPEVVGVTDALREVRVFEASPQPGQAPNVKHEQKSVKKSPSNKKSSSQEKVRSPFEKPPTRPNQADVLGVPSRRKISASPPKPNSSGAKLNGMADLLNMKKSQLPKEVAEVKRSRQEPDSAANTPEASDEEPVTKPIKHKAKARSAPPVNADSLQSYSSEDEVPVSRKLRTPQPAAPYSGNSMPFSSPESPEREPKYIMKANPFKEAASQSKVEKADREHTVRTDSSKIASRREEFPTGKSIFGSGVSLNAQASKTIFGKVYANEEETAAPEKPAKKNSDEQVKHTERPSAPSQKVRTKPEQKARLSESQLAFAHQQLEPTSPASPADVIKLKLKVHVVCEQYDEDYKWNANIVTERSSTAEDLRELLQTRVLTTLQSGRFPDYEKFTEIRCTARSMRSHADGRKIAGYDTLDGCWLKDGDVLDCDVYVSGNEDED